MSRQPAVLGVLALVAALAPAHAGTIYIPLPPQQTAGTIIYRTEVVAANTGATASPLTTAFLPAGSASGTPAHLTLLPHATFVLTNAAPAGREGMLAVTGDSQVAVTARLVAVGPSGKALGIFPLPTVDARNAAGAGDTVQIQGVSRPSAATTLRFGVINLGDDAAHCTASGFRSDGASAGAAVAFTLPAVAQGSLLSPLSSFGTRLFADARVEVTCDQPFYPYALQLGGAAGETAVHTPSAMLDGLDGETADSLLAAETAQAAGSDGEEPEADTAAQGSGPTVGKDSLSYAGVFLDARRNNSARTFTLPLRQGVRYRKITVDFDLYINKWQAPLFHAVTALRRNDRTLYNGLLVRADRAKTIIDLGHEQMAKGNGPWKQQTQYHIRMETDAGSRTVTFKLFRGGVMVHTVKGRLVSTDLSVSGGKVVSVDFGIGRIADGAYFPPIGWKYSNLNVKAEPFSASLAEAARLRGDGDGEGGGRGGEGTGGGSGSGGGGGGGAGSGPVTGQDTLSYSGIFLDAKQNNSTRAFTLPLRNGVSYRKITVDFDLYLNQWQTPLFHAVTSLRRNDRTLYNGLILRGDRAKTLIDLGREQMAKGDGPWKERTQYHLRIETDAGSRTVTLRVFQGNAVVHTVTGPLLSTDLSVSNGKAISVDFGIARVADGAYFPPLGWKYSNLNVKAEPF